MGCLVWVILFVLSWPLALAFLFLYPLVWLATLPLRLLGMTIVSVFALLRAIITLPFRLLGGL